MELANLLMKPNILPYLFLTIAIIIIYGFIIVIVKEYQLKKKKDYYNRKITKDRIREDSIRL